MKRLSCGVAIVDERGRLLMVHATGRRYWDIPKGEPEAGEAPRAAALRELLEETGLALEPAALRDSGRMPYRSGKDLHLFLASVRAEAIDLAACRCASFFPHHVTGAPTAEVDAYRWVRRDEVPALAVPSMAAILLRFIPAAG